MFPEKVLEESGALPETIPESDISGRKDFRKVLTFTIDPADAKDFDDAISFRKLKNDIYEIGVHIADVSHYVKPGTSLDEEAYDRATSVYLPDRVNPMLPKEFPMNSVLFVRMKTNFVFPLYFILRIREK